MSIITFFFFLQEPPSVIAVINIPGHDQLLLLYWEKCLVCYAPYIGSCCYRDFIEAANSLSMLLVLIDRIFYS